jgi:pilus assembly protein FimV
MATLDAHALGLGRLTVQSALGEPLRAEIDIAEITAEEASSLRAGVASEGAFKASGLDYTAAVTDIRVALQKRPDGRSFLRLTSPRPVSEPFVDLILEASWATGRIQRDYTLLFDPPSLRQGGTAGTCHPGARP